MAITSLTVLLPSGDMLTLPGRAAWALGRLLEAGEAGCTPIDQPAPRWSHYVFKLRKAGLVISTDRESHSGPYPGNHGRYRLETPVTIVSEDAK